MQQTSPFTFLIQAMATARRRSPFQTILGVIPIPAVLGPPTIQTEAYLENLYFEPVYLALQTYNEPVYNESIYKEELYGGIEPTI